MPFDVQIPAAVSETWSTCTTLCAVDRNPLCDLDIEMNMPKKSSANQYRGHLIHETPGGCRE